MTSKIELAPDVLFQDMDGEMVFLNLQNEQYFGLDEIGARMFAFLQEDNALENVILKMMNEYEVSEEKLRADIDELLATLREAKLITV